MNSPAAAALVQEGGVIRLKLSGDWRTRELPDIEAAVAAGPALDTPGELQLDTGDLGAWDSRLPAQLLSLQRLLVNRDCRLTPGDAPPGLIRLLDLATAVPVHTPPATDKPRLLSLAQLRSHLADLGDEFIDSLAFLGDTLRALARAASGRANLRMQDLVYSCYRSGPDALGIIALTSILVGMILAYLGAEQLRQFGAAIYVADLVAIGMLREMGALMTAVVMAGRTGAAYAAELSSMQANEEIDAIRTLGIPPMEFLVVPRILALCLTMPLLVIFADALGVIGGGIVAGSMGVTPLQYLSQLENAMALSHFLVGLGKALLFAMLIALAGCRAGMQAGRNSEAVGRATTEAVVTAVVYLIVADAAANILCQQLGI